MELDGTSLLSDGGTGEEGEDVPTSRRSEVSELLEDATDSVEYDLRAGETQSIQHQYHQHQ